MTAEIKVNSSKAHDIFLTHFLSEYIRIMLICTENIGKTIMFFFCLFQSGLLGIFQKLLASKTNDHQGFYLLNSIVQSFSQWVNCSLHINMMGNCSLHINMMGNCSLHINMMRNCSLHINVMGIVVKLSHSLLFMTQYLLLVEIFLPRFFSWWFQKF